MIYSGLWLQFIFLFSIFLLLQSDWMLLSLPQGDNRIRNKKKGYMVCVYCLSGLYILLLFIVSDLVPESGSFFSIFIRFSLVLFYFFPICRTPLCQHIQFCQLMVLFPSLVSLSDFSASIFFSGFLFQGILGSWSLPGIMTTRVLYFNF